MPPRCLRLTPILAVLAPAAFYVLAAAEPPPGRSTTVPPRLAVLVVFDQMRADYLTRWDRLFTRDGFHRLEAEGTWFQNCHYPYSDTVTGAGHASLATGCSPRQHGIIANDWYDRTRARMVYCVSSDRYERVPPLRTPARSALGRKRQGISPERLRAPTLGDVLKQRDSGRGRVVSLSLKDRAAVLMGGHQPDVCYWLDESTGEIVTSTYYRDSLVSWVEAFNAKGLVNTWQDQLWTHLRPDLDYGHSSGPDDVKGEGPGIQQGRVFPHPMKASQASKLSQYYGAVYTSPMGNELLLALAERAITAERLGQRDLPELLCLSFSSNDAVGHAWGPDSQEVLDITLRSDHIVERLLACLDQQVGKGRYLIAITADHGVCPLPEVSRQKGKAAGRISPDVLSRQASAYLSEHFHIPARDAVRWIEALADPWIYLNQAFLQERHLKPSDVEEALAGWLRQQEGIQAAYTRTQLLAGPAPEDSIGQMVRRSFDPDRSGDIAVVVKPYYLITSRLTGTSHGTPHDYDTHVPLLVAGPGIKHAVRTDAISPLAVAAILAHGLGVDPPRLAKEPLPPDLFTLPHR